MRKTPVLVTSALALLGVVAFAGPASATPRGTLAYTGGSTTPAIWAGVIGGIAGGALIWARRKRA